MKEILFKDICTPELMEGAILNEEYTGFKEDYLVLHCLVKKYKPDSFMEIGTNCGTGTQIIFNAHKGMRLFSLDLPPELAHISLQSPESEGKGNHRIGINCKSPFVQLFGDSRKYDFTKHYPIEGWFIDGEHVFENATIESKEAIKSKAKIIVWHDSDIPEVYDAIIDAFKKNKDYELFRVTDTRIAFAIKK